MVGPSPDKSRRFVLLLGAAWYLVVSTGSGLVWVDWTASAFRGEAASVGIPCAGRGCPCRTADEHRGCCCSAAESLQRLGVPPEEQQDTLVAGVFVSVPDCTAFPDSRIGKKVEIPPHLDPSSRIALSSAVIRDLLQPGSTLPLCVWSEPLEKIPI